MLDTNKVVVVCLLFVVWQLGEAICHFLLENMVPITHEQNIIRSKTRLDSSTHEQTIVCWQLFAGHAVGSRPMERKKNNASNDNIYLSSTLGLISEFQSGLGLAS